MARRRQKNKPETVRPVVMDDFIYDDPAEMADQTFASDTPEEAIRKMRRKPADDGDEPISSAFLDERIVIETTITKISPLSATFSQIIKNADTNLVHTIAEVEVVAVHNDGKIYRRLPEELKSKLERALECKD